MQHHPLFNRTRLHLAGWYAGVMGIILSLCGLGTYELVALSYRQAVDQELETIAGTLHDGLEAKLLQPDRITPRIERELLPGLCIVGQPCTPHPQPERHILGIGQQNDYYLQLFDRSGNLIAQLGQRSLAPATRQPTTAKQTLQDAQGIRYRQIRLNLKTVDASLWGTMQIGRSLQSLDKQLAILKFQILIGLPGGMILVALASWWLAGRAIRPIYQSYAQMQRFIADAAHELRTPLATIQATIEATRRQVPLTLASAQTTLETLDRQNRRLIQLAQDLLLLSRLESDQTSPHPNLIHAKCLCLLNDLVCDVVETLAVLEIGEPVTLQTDIRVQEPLYVLGSNDQLVRLLSNLITNALQHTAAGGNVWVILDREHDHALIQVKDTGQGIAPEDLPRIFDRFYRVQSDRSRQTGGTGLGLAIALAIAQAHQGTIQVHSVLGQGSLFTVRLPLNCYPDDWLTSSLPRLR